MVYKKWNEIANLTNAHITEERDIWACAYNYNLSNTYDYSMIPKLGRLHKHVFTPYKKDSDQLEKFSDISAFKLVYADTYEECVMLYNDLIQEKIAWHERKIEECKKDLLEEI